ncbi:acetylornithine transaminase [Calidifontibacter sp. DB0510]|uniref:Acetylornithine aminotransferase n=1 Tax=Metallococcus carri TaxID=1656884 RepID=A0A967EBJ7_9MICO|nr:acetylornithine transaminase [Metallococcus carri]NHN57390.1 acetylornithine transaminase [Metallococcus carri]NOP39214.1 acetylornithine transaminase [Calidifontibacter sp. DB2511S]
MTTELERYAASLLPVFGTPQLVIDHGDGAYVVDTAGRRYLDLVGGIAVNALGHNHPALVEAITKQAGQLVHVSNFFTTPAQIALAERLLRISGAPAGSKVFFCNSGTEAIEAAIKLSRRTGRRGLVAAQGAFHGRTTGALALTAKAAYREPFEPLIPDVTHVPYADVAALRAAVGPETAAIVLEPVQGEAGVVEPADDYLRAAREIASAAGALLIIDEVQTGIGRTGDWFGFQRSGIVPDAITVAKGLGGGVPIGALITFGEHTSGLLTAGQHGTTFGGNPLACAAGLAVLDTIEADGLLEHVGAVGDAFAARVTEAGIPGVRGVRGRGLLRAIVLEEEIAAQAVVTARGQGFLVNAVAPDALRLAPPLVITDAELATFADALPRILEEAA